MNKLFILLIISVVSLSCNNYKNQGIPDDVVKVLKMAGSNRKELLKVINHFKGDSLKLKASWFLIGNMGDKSGYIANALKKYDPLFNFIGSLRQKKMPITNNSPYIRTVIDSLKSVIGIKNELKEEKLPDYTYIKAEYLIEHINLAFAIRDSIPWGKKISFEQFCEYVLSYRFNNESLENWRSYYHNKYKLLIDSINADSCFQLASNMHKLVPMIWSADIFKSYPFDFLINQMETAREAPCKQISTYECMLCRSAGLPVAVDFTPIWGNHSSGHTWNALILENGKTFNFEGALRAFGQVFLYKTAKVYRRTFGRQITNYQGCEAEIPESIQNDHFIDVTSQYIQTFPAVVPIKYSFKEDKKYAIICTHDNKNWVPQDWGEIKDKRAYFKNMGPGNLYLVMFYDNGVLYPASDPFILNEKGELNFISPFENKTQDMFLLRKFPIRKNIQIYHDNMVHSSFQGANRQDFNDSINLFTVNTSPIKIETAIVTNSSMFRYVRFKSPIVGKGDVAEIEFYGGKKNADTLKLTGRPIGFPEVQISVGTPYQNAFDENIDTYFNGYDKKQYWWAGLDLGEPKIITKIKYCPRSDTNFIVEGDRYELCYWNKDQWVSMGEQVAKIPSLEFRNVPAGGLYILHNLSRGKEERIFTWEEGKQVFW